MAKRRKITKAPMYLNGKGPVYDQIQRAFRQRILSGELVPGQRIESEQVLVELFGVSRMTINRALTTLAQEGLLIRHRKKGTFVAHQLKEHTVLKIADIGLEVESAGNKYEYQLLNQKIITSSKKVLNPHFIIRDGTRVIQLNCMHRADGKPIMHENRLINLSAVPLDDATIFKVEPPSRWLLKHVPWTRATHFIRAVNVKKRLANRLKVTNGTACLIVERCTWQGNTSITWATLTYPGHMHDLVGHFEPGQYSGAQI